MKLLKGWKRKERTARLSRCYRK